MFSFQGVQPLCWHVRQTHAKALIGNAYVCTDTCMYVCMMYCVNIPYNCCNWIV